jgi:acetoacetate decarboxylase
LHYGSILCAVGTMGYKHRAVADLTLGPGEVVFDYLAD